MLRFVLFLSLAIAFYPVTVHAAWVDDWVSNTTNTSAQHFEGQQRGYLFAGSASARWPSTQDFAVSVQPPQLSAGCGGIDGFMGSFSYLGFDYLVDKLENMLMNAPAIAFDLALKALAEQASTSMGKFENIIDVLNGVQMDDCAASKNMLASMGVTGESMKDVVKEGITKMKQNTGDWTLFNVWNEEAEAAPNPDPQDGKDAVVSCSVEAKRIFLSNDIGGLLLDNVGVTEMGIPQSYVDLIRGLVGDIRIGTPAQMYKMSPVDSCPENDGRKVTAFISGDVKAKRSTGVCVSTGDVIGNLQTYVANIVSSVANSIRNRSQITNVDTLAFLNSNPIPIYTAMKIAVATGQEAAYITQITDLAAKAMAYQMTSDLYGRISFMLNKAQSSIQENSHGHAECISQIFTPTTTWHLDSMQEKLNSLHGHLRDSYTNTIVEYQTMFSVLTVFEKNQTQIKEELGRQFSASLADRVM